MQERADLIAHLEQYAEIAMGSDVGYHFRQLVEALQSEEDNDDVSGWVCCLRLVERITLGMINHDTRGKIRSRIR